MYINLSINLFLCCSFGTFDLYMTFDLCVCVCVFVSPTRNLFESTSKPSVLLDYEMWQAEAWGFNTNHKPMVRWDSCNPALHLHLQSCISWLVRLEGSYRLVSKLRSFLANTWCHHLIFIFVPLKTVPCYP